MAHWAEPVRKRRLEAAWMQTWGVQRLFVSQDLAGSQRWRALEPELRARCSHSSHVIRFTKA